MQESSENLVVEKEEKVVTNFLSLFGSTAIDKSIGFSFKQLFGSDSSDPKTPSTSQKRQVVNHKLEYSSFKKSICFNIINNLCCYYHKSFIELEEVSGLFKLIKTAYTTDKMDESIKARLLYCLHISKSERLIENDKLLDSIRLMNLAKASENTSTIIDRNKNIIEIKDLLSLYEELLSNKFIIENAKSITQSLTKSKPKDYDFSSTKIHFFTCYISTLRGFSGQDAIYINIDHIKSIFKGLKTDLEFQFKILFIKLEIIRIVQHELAHVFLRNSQEDLNCSSPELIKKLNLSSLYPEAGVLCERLIFESRIDYIGSSYVENTNYAYISDFIILFLKNQLNRFDLKAAKVLKSNEIAIPMAVDMVDKANIQVFE